MSHTMTDKRIEDLIKLRKDKAVSITDKVLDAVRRLQVKGKPTPKDIKEYLDDQTHKEIEEQYLGIKSHDELEEIIKKRSIVMRTIMRRLKKLADEEHVLDHVNNTYSVKDTLKSDIRLYARNFGILALSEMMKRDYHPSRNTSERNTEELIKAFGVYVIFCFAQAARPVTNIAGVDKYGDQLQTRDRLVSFWIQNVLSPLEMYNYFFAIIDSRRHQNDMKSTKRSFYELETETVEKILDTIEKKYPDHYKPLLETSSFFIKGPKESAVEHIRRKRKGK